MAQDNPMYEVIGNQEEYDFGQSKSAYTLSIKSRFQTPNEYQIPQVKFTPKSENVTLNQETVLTEDLLKTHDKGSKKCLTIITLFLLFLLILTLGALALSSFVLYTRKETEVVNSRVSADQLSSNESYWLGHLSTLTDKVNYLTQQANQSEIQYTSILTQLSNEIMALRTEILSTINTVQSEIRLARNLIESAQNDVISLNSNLSRVNNILRTPINFYQNCHQDEASCSITSIINDDRRALCQTAYLYGNITGFYTVDMRCLYTGYHQLEVPSLQTSDGVTFICQCSIVEPNSGGFATLSLSSGDPFGNCTLIITRCPLSQTIN